jgi:hypothetical protein
MNNDLTNKFEMAKKFIKEREEKEKAEINAKILGTAMQQLLPDIYKDKRIIPNCFLRGALFGMVRKGRRKLIENQPIFTMSQYELFFSGSELDQNDLETWDTLIYLAKNKNINNELRITLYELCKILKLVPTNTSYNAILKRIARLQFGQLRIRNKNQEFGGSLINNYYIDTANDGKLVIEYNKKLAPLFTEDYTFINVDTQHILGSNQLCKWLYNFYESHSEPMPFAIDFIQKLCRSESELKEFKRSLKLALERVKTAHLIINLKSKWDYEITENNFLIVYPKGKTNPSKLFNKF